MQSSSVDEQVRVCFLCVHRRERHWVLRKRETYWERSGSHIIDTISINLVQSVLIIHCLSLDKALLFFWVFFSVKVELRQLFSLCSETLKGCRRVILSADLFNRVQQETEPTKAALDLAAGQILVWQSVKKWLFKGQKCKFSQWKTNVCWSVKD